MSKFIEEFYYGNIDPQARSTKQNKTVQKQMEVLMLNEEFLTEELTGENKKKFLDFTNAWSIVNGESNLDSFINYVALVFPKFLLNTPEFAPTRSYLSEKAKEIIPSRSTK